MKKRLAAAGSLSRWLPAVLLVLSLGGCAALTALDPDEAFSEPPQAVELTDVPHHPQEALQCGPAALAAMLQWSGHDVAPETLKPDLFVPARRGTFQSEIKAQSRARDRVPYRIPGTHDAIVAELHAGNPVMVFQNLGLGWLPVWHYAVVVGYKPDNHAYVLRSGEHKRQITTLDRFRRTWERGDNWAIVVVRPDELPATAQPAHWLRAGLDLEETGRASAARAAYERGRAHWPRHGGFHVALVNLHHGEGDARGAAAAARRGLDEAESLRGVLNNNLAMLLLEQGRYADAENKARAALEVDSPFTDAFKDTLETICQQRTDGAACDAQAD
ncbi:PA2778 family cysteine peptidase [Aquisalimonas sp.]|uniref:PA2778 family cysteine peptidase n=1 Tax=Aquisalimonas sp. TaxID=1872621 RepID=UPI0025B95F28|nr:PA2778 family cysteine peptidase [Aquisalimonas sp.]